MVNNSTDKSARQSSLAEFKQKLDEERHAYLEQEKHLKAGCSALGIANIEALCGIDLNSYHNEAKRKKIQLLQYTAKKIISEKARLWPEDNVVEELNRKHAIIRIEQTFILTQRDNPIFGGHDFTFESRSSFKLFYEDEEVMCSDGKMRSKADIWLRHPLRRKYAGIVFDPSTTGPINGHYNIWHGFTMDAEKGDCSKYWDHVRNVICADNIQAYNYVRKWLAYVFQRPDEVHTALVIIGSQGVGKNSFVDPLGTLLGQHFIKLSNIGELLSHFNFHLKNAVLINANEVSWLAGSKKDIGTLKAMITEPACSYEGKGKDAIQARNYRHFIVTSNEDWAIHLDPDDRRTIVLRAVNSRIGDRKHFEEIRKQLEHGGYAALLYDLLNEDLTDFDPRVLPKNSYEKFAMSLRSADSSHRYIYAALIEGNFGIGELSPNASWNWGTITKKQAYGDYKSWCENNGERTAVSNVFHRSLSKLIPSLEEHRRRKDGDRLREYEFPSLEKTRAEFAAAYKIELEEVF